MNSELIRKEIVIDWKYIFLSIVKKWWIIALCLIIGAGTGYGLGVVADVPVYESQAVYVLSYSDGGESVSSMTAEYSFLSRILFNCTEILKQNTFAQLISSEVNEGLTEDSENYIPVDTLQECISYSYPTGGTLIYVTVDAESAELSYRIVSAISHHLQDYVRNTYNLAGKADMVFSLVNMPELPEKPAASNTRMMFTAIGGVAFAGICAAIIAFIALLDTRIKTEEDLKNRFNAPILGTIPDFFDPEIKKGGYYRYGYGSK